MFDDDFFEEEKRETPQDRLKASLDALDGKSATEADVIQGIEAAIRISRDTAMDGYKTEQMHKHRFGSKKMPALSLEKALVNHCGNTAYQVNLLLDHPDLSIEHHQMNKQGVALNHHFLSVGWQGKQWVVDPSAPQFKPHLQGDTTPEQDEFLDKGYFDTARPEMVEAFQGFYNAVDRKACFSQNMGEMLAHTRDMRPDAADIADGFVLSAQKTRRGMGLSTTLGSAA